MNQREPTSAPLGAGPAFPCLALLILSLLTVVRAWSRPMTPQWSASTQARHYLVALGAPPLRFQELAPPPDLTSRPPAAAPPQPPTEVVEDFDVAMDDVSLEFPFRDIPSSTSFEFPTVAPTTVYPENESEAVPVEPRTPPPILRDEMRPQARPEDFLPFFQIPVSQPGDVSVMVPVPRAPAASTPLPASSATYTQSP